MELKIRAPAKINLVLKVLGRRDDGYHELQMVMQTIGIYDTITLMPDDSGAITLKTNGQHIPIGPENLAYKAASLLKNTFNIKSGLKILLEKHIPTAAGLGGGSSDAAAVLKGLNRLWNIGLQRPELEHLGVQIGADVAFFIGGGRSVVKGIGDKVEQLPYFPSLHIVVVKPPLDISTGWVYNMYDELMPIPQKKLSQCDWASFIQAIKSGDASMIASRMFNDLAPVVDRFYPVINELTNQLINLNALGAMMSGSGSAVFGIFDSEKNARAAGYILKQRKEFQVFITQTVGGEG